MKSYKTWLIIVLVLLAINSAALAIMWFHHKKPLTAREHGDARQPMEAKDVLIKELRLTEKQQGLYTTMREGHIQITQKLGERGRLLHDSLFSYIRKPKIDSAVVNKLTNQISDNQTQLEKATLYHFRSFRTILTPEQQSKFDNIINDVLRMMSRPGAGGQHSERGYNNLPPDSNKRGQAGRPHGMPHRGGRDGHFGPPPNGMPPPDGDRRHHGPPPDGMPPDGPPPNGGPPNGPPPDGRPPF